MHLQKGAIENVTCVTKQINAIRETPGVPIWQRNYYDHIIRNEESLKMIREYGINNPLSWHDDKLFSTNEVTLSRPESVTPTQLNLLIAAGCLPEGFHNLFIGNLFCMAYTK